MRNYLIIQFFWLRKGKPVFLETSPYKCGYSRYLELRKVFGVENVTYKVKSPLTMV